MKYKRIVVIFALLVLSTGCTKVMNLEKNDIIKIFEHDPKRANKSRSGFKYYLPSGMTVNNRGTYFEIIKSSRNYYYLYIDLISYVNEAQNEYTKKDSAFYSEIIKTKDKVGYIEINLNENKQYLIEIMYNYAKIEVMVDSEDVNEALLYSVNILNSVEYNKSVIKNLISDKTLNYTEEEFNLFKTGVDNSNILQYIEESEDERNNSEDIKDTDYIS